MCVFKRKLGLFPIRFVSLQFMQMWTILTRSPFSVEENSNERAVLSDQRRAVSTNLDQTVSRKCWINRDWSTCNVLVLLHTYQFSNLKTKSSSLLRITVSTSCLSSLLLMTWASMLIRWKVILQVYLKKFLAHGWSQRPGGSEQVAKLAQCWDWRSLPKVGTQLNFSPLCFEKFLEVIHFQYHQW